MKQLILGISFLFFLSCQDNLIPSKPNSSQLVLFAYILPGEPVLASVTKSIYSFENNRELALVDSVLVTLYENDILVDTLEKIDSVLYLSNIKAVPEYTYKIQIKDISSQLPTLISDEIMVLKPPNIKEIFLDSLVNHELGSSQDKLQLTVSFDTISNYRYIAYTTEAYEINRSGHRWNTKTEYLCTQDEIASILDVSLAYIGCFNEMHEIVFESQNHNLQKLDSIRVKICKMPDFTGDFRNVSKLNRVAGDPFLSVLASDDNLPSNVSEGYGAVLTISCTEEVFVIEK